MKRNSGLLLSLVLVALLSLVLPVINRVSAQDNAVPDAEIVNDEGGPVVITGNVTYTNTFFTEGADEPLIILEDQAGFVDRDKGFIMPAASQVLGQITSDFYTSPFTYSISLPIEPQASLRDVDHDGQTETGVMIYAIAYWNNVFGPPELEERDLYGGGWSTAYVSTNVDPDASDDYTWRGGTILVYAPDGEQSFPSGFGDDAELFTDDDPIVNIPQGYTVVNLDTDPFTFDRSREPQVDLLEGEGAAATDFSSLSFTEAFDAMVEKFRNEYAFSELKTVDYDALVEALRPRVEEAEANNDLDAYGEALQEFIWSIPDIHLYVDQTPAIQQRFQDETSGGLGLSLGQTDDGQFIVTFILPGGPAAEAGIERGAEVTSINGQTVEEAMDATTPWAGPFSTRDYERLQQLRYAIRFPVGEDVELTYQNPDDSEPETTTLTTIAERESHAVSSFAAGLTGAELPLEYDILPSGYAYVKIYSFIDAQRLTIDLWERMIDMLNQQGIPGLIIDMRQNGGGYGFTAAQMSAYFFDTPHVLERNENYNRDTGEWEIDEERPLEIYLPPEEQRYHGDIAVIVAPSCVSACEFFARDMAYDERAAVVGHYSTAGGGGSVEDFFMPGPLTVRMPIARSLDEDDNIIIEGIGVVPTVDVPVTAETLLSSDDVLLQAAVEYLDGQTGPEVEDRGAITLEEIRSDVLEVGIRHQYAFTSDADMTVDVILGEETGQFDTVLTVYDADGNVIAENDDYQDGSFNSAVLGLDVTAGETFIIEVGSYGDAGEGEYELTVSEAE